MHVHRAASAVRVFAPAKLNLFLEVSGKRADGFHEIETLMVPVALWDTLTLWPTADSEVQCRVVAHQARGGAAPQPALPAGEENLAVRAVLRLRERAGIAAGARMVLVKRIAQEAGLAGGSSDAAAALVAANAAWRLDWPRAQLAAIAAELGSDVPFFLADAPAVCRGRGELVEPLRGLAPLPLVVVRPPVGLSTAEVYARCRPASAPRRSGELVAAWRRIGAAGIGSLLFNRLQQAAAMLSPWIERIGQEFDRLDFLGHQMTGSGSAYFGVCRTARHARRLASALRNRPGCAGAMAVMGLT